MTDVTSKGNEANLRATPPGKPQNLSHTPKTNQGGSDSTTFRAEMSSNHCPLIPLHQAHQSLKFANGLMMALMPSLPSSYASMPDWIFVTSSFAVTMAPSNM